MIINSLFSNQYKTFNLRLKITSKETVQKFNNEKPII